jgi:hypothetical protein
VAKKNARTALNDAKRIAVQPIRRRHHSHGCFGYFRCNSDLMRW